MQPVGPFSSKLLVASFQLEAFIRNTSVPSLQFQTFGFNPPFANRLLQLFIGNLFSPNTSVATPTVLTLLYQLFNHNLSVATIKPQTLGSKPPVSNLQLQPFSCNPLPLVPNFELQLFSPNFSVVTPHLYSEVFSCNSAVPILKSQLFSCNSSAATLHRQFQAFSRNPSVSSFQSQAASLNLSVKILQSQIFSPKQFLIVSLLKYSKYSACGDTKYSID